MFPVIYPSFATLIVIQVLLSNITHLVFYTVTSFLVKAYPSQLFQTVQFYGVFQKVRCENLSNNTLHDQKYVDTCLSSISFQNHWH